MLRKSIQRYRRVLIQNQLLMGEDAQKNAKGGLLWRIFDELNLSL